MDNSLLTTGLPLALALIMCSLGLSLTVEDFRRVAKSPAAVGVSLAVQMLILPVLAFGLVVVFDLEPLLAVGVLLLAASPGGTTANIFSHLFGGDVALNVSLTAINSVLSLVTLPLVTNLAVAWFAEDQDQIGLQFGKVISVFAIVLVPVLIGMTIRRLKPSFAEKTDRPARVFSSVVLALVAFSALYLERDILKDYLGQIGLVTGLFCAMSLGVGYGITRLLAFTPRQSVAAAFEVGIHNTTLAMTIAISVMGSSVVAVPAAVYSMVMYILATAFGFLVARPAIRASSAVPTESLAD